MNGKVALHEPAPIERRSSVLEQVQASMRERVRNLDPESKGGRGSIQLLAAIDTLRESATEAGARMSAIRTVKHRLIMLKRVTNQRFCAAQERDTLIVLLFVNSRMREVVEYRKEACALLALKGSDAAKEQICNLFPGLSTAFD